MNFDSTNEKRSAGMTTSGMSFISFPSHPGRKRSGTNATTLVKIANVTGIATSRVHFMEASIGGNPFLPKV